MFSGLSFIHISEAQRGEGCPVFLKAVSPVFDRLAKRLQRLPFCGEDPRSNVLVGKQLCLVKCP